MSASSDSSIWFDDYGLSTENAYWGALTANLLHRLGLKFAVISPGSRSTPLAFAFAMHPGIHTIPVLDERSAAFFALGKAKQSGWPVALICTSGTATANYFPAVIEARYSHIPLLVLTADRPPELRHCHSGQTIDQVGLYGNYPVFQGEMGFPDISAEGSKSHCDLLFKSWNEAGGPKAGPVHLNCPFRDPLGPDPSAKPVRLDFDVADLIRSYEPGSRPEQRRVSLPFKPGGRGIILAGPASPANPDEYCLGVAGLSKALGWPVFAEGLSPLRSYEKLNPYLISGYDIILLNSEIEGKWVPDHVIQLGSLPTSKRLRAWLEKHAVPTVVLDPSRDRRDPLNRPTRYLQCRVEDCSTLPAGRIDSAWLEPWVQVEKRCRKLMGEFLDNEESAFEGKIPYLLSRYLTKGFQVMIANSMPVRDVELFWTVSDGNFSIFCNRGANGIDGTLSTALGIAHQSGPACLLTGDLALLHDSNGFLVAPHFEGSLTIVLVNNHGGGIFENLPISHFENPFVEYFKTPQEVDFECLFRSHGISWEKVENGSSLKDKIRNMGSDSGIHVIEVETDPGKDVPLRQELTGRIASLLLQ